MMEENLRISQLKKTVGGVNLNDLSVYRGMLMGFAILIIVFYHFCNRGGTTNIDKLFRALFSQGYVGVDIFMVVSGLGLSFSLLKNDNLREYYIKRWVRIFPFFTFITLIECWIIKGESLGLSLLRSTTLGYWFGFPYIDWYVPAIVGLYAFFPIIFHLVVKPRRYWSALMIGIMFFFAALFFSKYEMLDWYHLCFVYRIPDFLLGCMAAVAIKDGYNESIVIKVVFLLVICGMAFFVLRYWIPHYKWFVNLCFTPLYLLLLCWIFKKLSVFNYGKLALVPLGFVGVFTLELYRISSSFERLLLDETCPSHHFLFVLIYAAMSIVLSYLAYRLFCRINAWLLELLLNQKITTRK